MKNHSESEGGSVATAVQEEPSEESPTRKPTDTRKPTEKDGGADVDSGRGVDVPGPEEAWLRGGTAVPEGSFTEAAAAHTRKPVRVEEVGTVGERRPTRSAARPERRSPNVEPRQPAERRDRKRGAAAQGSPRRRAEPAEDRGGRRDEDVPDPFNRLEEGPQKDSTEEDGRNATARMDVGARETRRRPPRQRPPRERQERRPFDPSDVEMPAGLGDEGESDPLKRALALFSRIGEPSGDDADTGSAAREETAPAEESRAGGEPVPATPDVASSSAEAAAGNGRATQTAREEVRRPRPARPIYTLQDVHERTGIPYATLALYAVSHRERIPYLGERHSPAYPREGLEEFCRIHAERNPDWQRPAEGTERGWDDEAALSNRLEALEKQQDRLTVELRSTLAQVRQTWKGDAEWV